MVSPNKIDFIGIGGPKCGSTWIGQCLEEHPEILFSSKKTRKELFFFNEDDVWGDNRSSRLSYYKKGLKWYLDQFPEEKPGFVRGEFTTAYMADPIAYKRIHEAFPDIKILATLRNPTDMVYSLYWYIYNGAIQKLPDNFRDALQEESLIEKGYYYKHLKKFYELFPKDNIHIIFYEDIKNNPKEVLRSLYKFLSVDENFVPPSYEKKINAAFSTRSKVIKELAYNTMNIIYNLRLEWLRLKIIESKHLLAIYTWLNKIPTRYPPISDGDRQKCIEIYKEDIKNLEEFLGRDLSSWR